MSNFKTNSKRDLEQDLIDCQFIKDKVRNEDGYDTRLYDALCNTNWYHDSDLHGDGSKDDSWHCSWRYAGGVVAILKVADQIISTITAQVMKDISQLTSLMI